MDPYVVEFMRSEASYAIDTQISYEIERLREMVLMKLRKGDIRDARYITGQSDGLELAISVLENIRKEDI